ELAILAELHDARIGIAAVAVSDENVAVRRGYDRRWRIELVVAAAGDAGLAKREQKLAVGTEFENLMPLALDADAVGDPDIAVAIDVQAVREDQHSGAEALDQLAGGIEFENRVKG